MRITYTASVSLPGLDGIAKNVAEELRKAVARTTFAIEGDAKLNAPIDTGFLRSTGVSYGGAIKRAVPSLAEVRRISLRQMGKKNTERFMSRKGGKGLTRPLPAPGRFEARVSFLAEYAVYQEKKKRFMSGALLKNRATLRREAGIAFEIAQRSR